MNDELNHFDWLAFQYVADELADDEREAFESQLADDQHAREALARAVETMQAIAAAEWVECDAPLPAVRVAASQRNVSRWRRATWLVASVAICLVVVLAYQLISGWRGIGRPQGNDFPQVAQRDGLRRLAPAWLQALDEVAPGEDESLSVSDVAEEAIDATSASPLDEDSELSPPDWLLAAVSGLAGKTMGSETDDSSHQADK
jgi:anti-sigma factor RsiW